MKFMVTWRLHADKRHEALKAFSEMSDADDSRDLAGVRLIGRWHDVIGFTGVAIAETDDPKALSEWLLHWNNVLDVQSVPVLDDNEARELARKVDLQARRGAAENGFSWLFSAPGRPLSHRWQTHGMPHSYPSRRIFAEQRLRARLMSRRDSAMVLGACVVLDRTAIVAQYFPVNTALTFQFQKRSRGFH